MLVLPLVGLTEYKFAPVAVFWRRKSVPSFTPRPTQAVIPGPALVEQGVTESTVDAPVFRSTVSSVPAPPTAYAKLSAFTLVVTASNTTHSRDRPKSFRFANSSDIVFMGTDLPLLLMSE